MSRYKLDQFLQLFDFPAPTISAEQRFTTNVPLQRLFLMNSDFMQQQAEQLAQTRRGRARQPPRRSRKAYRYALRPRPERDRADRRPRVPAPPNRCAPTKNARRQIAKKPADGEEARRQADGARRTRETGRSDGRGHDGGRGAPARRRKDDAKKKLLPVTPLGRYLKVLFSSTEFLFID